MQQQVITIGPDGIMSGLQVKPGKGVDLTKLGKASVVRASEIVWHDEKQLWYVNLLGFTSILSGPLDLPRWISADLSNDDLPKGTTAGILYGTHAIMFFPDYDLAVQAEIAYLDAMRLKGIF